MKNSITGMRSDIQTIDFRNYYQHSNKQNQVVLKFPNDYGASIVRDEYTYGGKEGLFELAVIKWVDDKFDICYDTPITDDVIGYLSGSEVIEVLTDIFKL